MNKNKIVVIGGNHHNTLGVIRSLGFKGLKSILLLEGNDDSSYVARSRFIEKTITFSRIDEITSILIKISDDFEEKAVVIVCHDGAASVVDQNQDLLRDKYYLPGSRNMILTRCMNKAFMSEMGQNAGFRTPPSWVVGSIDDIEEIEYPCITKPILSKDGSKADIRICTNRNELELLIKEGSCYQYQVQKFIEKDFEYQLIGLSLNNGDDIIIPGVSHCLRPRPRTNTGFLKYDKLDSYNAPLGSCYSFIKEIGYSGLFSIEFLRDKGGVDYFMEMNFRNDGNSICVTKAGCNLPYLWFLANTGQDYQQELAKCSFKPVIVMPEIDDFQFVKEGKISIFTWLKDVIRSDAFMEFDSKDIKPFMSLLLSKVIGRLKR